MWPSYKNHWEEFTSLFLLIYALTSPKAALCCVNSSHLINADWLTTAEQFASGISQYPSESSTPINMLETIPGTARGLGSSRGCLGQEKHRERPKTVRRNTGRGNMEINREQNKEWEEQTSQESQRLSSQRHSETRRKSAIWTWVRKPHFRYYLLMYHISQV